MRGIKIVAIFILVLSLRSLAQVDSSTLRTSTPEELRKFGRNAMKQDDPGAAIFFLESYLRQRPDDVKATELLAQAYMRIREYELAGKMFFKAHEMDSKKAPEALYYYAQMQKSAGEYDKARKSFSRFSKDYAGKRTDLKRHARKEVTFCDSVATLIKNKENVVISRLDSSVNKMNAEGAPVNLDTATLLYSSLRTDGREYVTEDDYSQVKKKKIYMARRQKGRWIFAGEFSAVNDAESNNGNVSFSVDRKRMYFTRCNRNLSGKMICALYVSQKDGAGWSEPVKLPKEINHRRFTSTMPAVTNDPVKGNDVIYFVSDRRGGKGGRDIWYTIYDTKKKFYKKVRNAGNKVNTTQDEITPFFDNETRALYYSSNGLGGLGGFDIYKATGDGRRFTSTRNLGAAFNTGADDIYFTIAPGRDEGFFVSNRKGGTALPNSTCCDDIYTYKLPEYIQVTLKGSVMDMINGELPIRNALVDIYVKDQISGERFFVKSTTSDSLGNYTAKLEPGQDYFVVVRKKDFLGTTEEVSTKGMAADSVISRHVKVVKKPKGPVPIPDFNYDFGKAELNAAQKTVLDRKLVDVMLANPEVIVEIQSHTDNKGNELFNQKLSQKRSDIIVNYVVSKGIEPARIVGKGYGESQPLVPNENPNGTDNPENRAKNRRTEFKFIGVIATEEPQGLD